MAAIFADDTGVMATWSSRKVNCKMEATVQKILIHPKFLFAYSILVTLALGIVIGLSFAPRVRAASKVADFDRIRVHRIDVVEPNGTPRLILSDKAEYPGSFFRGREVARPDRAEVAGLLFINDEGSEDGGLIYGGAMKDGKPSSFSHLSFDQYEQDQTVVIGTALDPDGSEFAGFTLNDVSTHPLTPEVLKQADTIKAMPHGPKRAAAWAAFVKEYGLRQRAVLRRNEDGSVGLGLRDKDGRVRLRVALDANGQPSIQFLDASGKVERVISSAAK